MENSLKTKWIEALRSGEYEQTQGQLKQEDGDSCSYCCLGVLADIWGKGKWDEQSYICGEEELTSNFNDSQLEELGLKEWQQDVLIDFNDNYGYGFKEIADYIEGNLDKQIEAMDIVKYMDDDCLVLSIDVDNLKVLDFEDEMVYSLNIRDVTVTNKCAVIEEKKIGEG